MTEKQQEPVKRIVCAECNGSGEMETGIGMFPCDVCHGSGVKYYLTVPPTAALAARQMRDAAVKVCRESEIPFDIEVWINSTKKQMTAHTALALADKIAALPVPEVKWRDLTDDEIVEVLKSGGEILLDDIHAVIAKFKEKQL